MTVQQIAVEWSFLGNSVFASGGSPQCAPVTITNTPLNQPPGIVSSPYSQQLAALGG